MGNMYVKKILEHSVFFIAKVCKFGKAAQDLTGNLDIICKRELNRLAKFCGEHLQAKVYPFLSC
jgi:hypothetical protein